MKRKKGLYIVHLRGPLNGAKVVSRFIKDTYESKGDFFDIASVNASQEVGRFSFAKVFESIFYVLCLSCKLVLNNYRFCYFCFTGHGFVKYRDILLLSLFSVTRVRVILHLHAELELGLLLGYMFKVLTSNKVIICINSCQKDRVRQIVNPSASIEVLPNRILTDENYLADLQYKMAIENSSSLNFLFLSNLVRGKGIERILRPFSKFVSEVCKSGIRIRLHIVGDVLDKEYYNEISRLISELDIGELCVFHGRVVGREKEFIIDKCSVFLFGSELQETFGLVNIEAMARALAVITYRTDCAVMFVDQGCNGFIVDTEDMFEKSLIKVSTDLAFRKRMMECSFQKSKDFHVNYFRSQFDNIFEGLYEDR